MTTPPTTLTRSWSLALIVGLLLATASSMATRATTLPLPAGTTFNASASYPGAGPGNAFDGNPGTLWNAGRHPLAWIEVDFGSPQELSGMHGLVSQSPAGNTVHQVSLDGVPAFTWSGATSDSQTLDHVFATPQLARRVRITTTSSPSWVAWSEITFDGPSTAPPAAAADVYRTLQDRPIAIDVRSLLVGHWTFEPGVELRDLAGNFGDLALQNGAAVADGQLNLDAAQAAFSGAYAGPALSSKTLVAWLRLDSLDVQAGSPLSLEQLDVHGFDAIVYGERESHRWMAGSDFFNRTQDFDPGFAETTTGDLVQVAITYEDLGGGLVRIRGYRNGIQIGDYTSTSLRVWNPGVIAKFGPRTGGAGSIDAHIDEARIYSRVLTGSDLAALSLIESSPIDNLVGYWNFDDGTARDSSGSNNHGVPTGGAIVDGVLGRGLDLRGGGNVITIPNSTSLQTARFTVAYWAKLTVPQNPVIITKRSATGDGDAWQSSVTGPVGRWIHVAMTYDGTTVTTYTDGVLVESVDVSLQPELSDADITIGGQPGGDDFEGLLDEVRLYDAALSAADVAALAATRGVLLNDVSTSGGPLTAVKMTDPQHGTVSLSSDGGFVYTPNAGFGGVDSFIYRAFDGTVSSQDATVTINVTPVCAPGAYLASPTDVACTAAPAGTYVPEGGATAPIACPAGFTSLEGATACVPQVQRLAEFDFENVVAQTNGWVGPLSAPASGLQPAFTSGTFGWTDTDGILGGFGDHGVQTWATNVYITRGLGPVGAPGLTQLFVDLHASSAWSLTGFSARLLHNDFPSMPIDVIAVQNGVSTLLGTVVSNCTTYPDCHRSFDISSAPHEFAAGPVRLVLAPQFNTGSAFVMVDDIRIDGFVDTTTPVVACTAGTYLASPSDTACTPASPGTYVAVDDATEAIACPVGTFSDIEGAEVCQLAPAGTFVDTVGAISATTCPTGTTSTEGAVVCTNTAPTLTPLPVVVTANQAVTGALATVGDAETDASALTVQVVSAAEGVTVTNLVNISGTVSGVVTATCAAVSGPLMLSVADAASMSAVASVQVTVMPATVPTIGTFGEVTLNPGESVTVTPSSPATGAVGALGVMVGGGFTGVATIAPSGAVSIASAGPGGSYPVTVTVAGACGSTTTTFTVSVRTGGEQAAILAGTTIPALIKSGDITRAGAGQLMSAGRWLERQLTMGNPRSAAAAVNTFTNVVRATLSSGRITVEAAQMLLRAAESLLGAPPPNLTPVALSGPQTTTEDRTRQFNIGGRDANTGDLLTFRIVTAPQHGTVTIGAPRMLNSSTGPYWVALATYVPNRDYFGPDSFTFTVFDGLAASAPRTQMLTVTPVNDRPVATPQVLTVESGATLAITLSGTDVDGDPLTYKVGRPRYSTLTGAAPNVVYTAPTVPRAVTDSFTFRVTDDQGAYGTATVTIRITPVNAAPVCRTATMTVSARPPRPVWLTLSVGDPNGDALTFAWTSAPAYGTTSPIALNGRTYGFTFTPTAQLVGKTDTFTYTATDPSGLSTSCTVVVRGR